MNREDIKSDAFSSSKAGKIFGVHYHKKTPVFLLPFPVVCKKCETVTSEAEMSFFFSEWWVVVVTTCERFI